jgi:hypothetical protein
LRGQIGLVEGEEVLASIAMAELAALFQLSK